MPEAAVTETHCLANVRIHAERAIRRLKCFKILSNILPGRVGNDDGIVTMSAGVCNLQLQLISEDIAEDLEKGMGIDNDTDGEEEAQEEDRYMLDFANGI